MESPTANLSLDPAVIQTVRHTHMLLHCVSSTASQMFCAYLFESSPELTAHYAADLPAARVKAVAMLRMVVDSLDKPDLLLALVYEFVGYAGVYKLLLEHTHSFEDALLRSLGRVLGPAFTREVALAWRTMYRFFVALMRHVADEARADQALPHPEMNSHRRRS